MFGLSQILLEHVFKNCITKNLEENLFNVLNTSLISKLKFKSTKYENCLLYYVISMIISDLTTF